MCAEPQDNQRNLWNRVLDALAQQVGPGIFDTWFRPVGFGGCKDNEYELVVPSEMFRRCLMEYYSDILSTTIYRVTGSQYNFRISVMPPEPCDGPRPFPVLRAADIETAQNTESWLIERLWTAGAAGFVSGPPKSLKTWTVLEMAVSVTSGTPCFGSFPVPRPGPVLLYAAEDPLPALRRRIQSLARNHGLAIEQLDIHVITADSLRLDRPVDRDKLTATVDLHHPTLVILDPLVRLHGLDENQAGPMAQLLGHIRTLQRISGAAFAITHHSRKNGTQSAGQSMRGSSDLYAFLDSLVSLQRHHGRLSLSAEHRSAPRLGPLSLELVTDSEPDCGPSLRLCTTTAESQPQGDPLRERITKLLREAQDPLTTDSIRAVLQVRKQRVLETLRGLCDSGLILRDANGYRLVAKSQSDGDRDEVPVPAC
jgi:hypothetical protein